MATVIRGYLMLRSTTSRAIGGFVVDRYWRAFCSRRPWSLSSGTWSLIPDHVRHWLSYRVFEVASERAHGLVSDGHPLVDVCRNRFTNYTLPASSVLLLWDLLHRSLPTRILELGSGMSTGVFATYAREQHQNGKGHFSILSLEHDEQWADATRRMLIAHELESYAQVVHAPIAMQAICGRSILAYDILRETLSSAAGDAGFDVCLIDGPPAKSVGRLGSFLLAKDFLAPGATVILDDAFRAHEQSCWSRWMRITQGSLSHGTLVLVPHGMLIGTWNS